MGCRSLATSLDDFKNHPWFARINWERLESKQLDSPFKPNVRPLLSFSYIQIH